VRQAPPALRRTRPGVTVDFSSIAKGFASDALSMLLNGLGVNDHFVQIGGDIKTGGHSVDEEPWRAAIETPDEDQHTVVSVVKLSGHALSTSGDYRNFVIRNGRRYGHIIDPRTGFPAATGLAAVSVIDASCARSSAFATALFVLGPTHGFKLATEQKLACVFFIRRANGFDRRATPQFEVFAR
jgi:thiamine biosynthesis lipoprotein